MNNASEPVRTSLLIRNRYDFLYCGCSLYSHDHIKPLHLAILRGMGFLSEVEERLPLSPQPPCRHRH
jgi:hypothetical protein